MTNTEKKNKMTFEEKCKTPKGAFWLNIFCMICWSFVAIMNLIDFNPASKSDIYLLIIDSFLAIFYFIFSIISFRKMKKSGTEQDKKNVVVV